MKAIHPNSVAAYWTGSLDLFGKRHKKVLEALRAARGPRTDREVMVACGFADPNSVRPRITELLEAGILWESGSVECPVTRREVRLVALATREAQAEFALGDVLTTRVLEELTLDALRGTCSIFYQ